MASFGPREADDLVARIDYEVGWRERLQRAACARVDGSLCHCRCDRVRPVGGTSLLGTRRWGGSAATSRRCRMRCFLSTTANSLASRVALSEGPRNR